MSERDAIYIVESVKDLTNAVADRFVGEFMEDDDSEHAFIVLRENDHAVLWICKNTVAHEILVELEYAPDEFKYLYDTMDRLSRGNPWTFYDSAIWCNMPYEKYNRHVRMSWRELGNQIWVDLLGNWYAVFHNDVCGSREILCHAWKNDLDFYYRELDPMTGEILYSYSVTANEFTIEKFLSEMTARAEPDEWMLKE